MNLIMVTRILQAIPPAILAVAFTLRLSLVDDVPLGDDLPYVGLWSTIFTLGCYFLAFLSLIQHTTPVLQITAAFYVLLAGMTAALGVGIFAWSGNDDPGGWWETRNYLGSGVTFALSGYFLLGWWMITRIAIPDRAATQQLQERADQITEDDR